MNRNGLRKRIRTNAEQRREWVERWNRSGLSAEEFATSHGFVGSSLLRRERESEKSSSDLVAVRPVLKEIPVGGLFRKESWAAEWVQPDGHILRLNAEMAAQLIEAMRR